MNQTIAELDVAPSRQQKRGISGHRVFSLVQKMGKDGNEDNRKTPPEFITPIAFKQELPTRHNHIPEGNHHQA